VCGCQDIPVAVDKEARADNVNKLQLLICVEAHTQDRHDCPLNGFNGFDRHLRDADPGAQDQKGEKRSFPSTTFTVAEVEKLLSPCAAPRVEIKQREPHFE